MNHPRIPRQKHGYHHDTVTVACLNYEEEANRLFHSASERLLSINEWYEMANKIHTKFILCNADGQRLTRTPSVGDYVKIDILGPGNPDGRGYDWVQVQRVESSEAEAPYLLLELSPVSYPPDCEAAAAHFFGKEASSTFIIRKMGLCVYAEVHGRNEVVNTCSDSVLARVRNQAVKLANAVGVAKVEWKHLTDALLGQPE